LRADLPLAALRMAISAQRPGAGLIHHSDRGVQYASAEYRNVLQSGGFKASMSRKAHCYDNAPMESFFHTLKTAIKHIMRPGPMPPVIFLLTSKASTIGPVVTRRSAISARSRWS